MLRSHCNCQSHDPTGIDWNPWNRTSLSPSEPRTKSVTQTANGDNGEVRGERRATPRWRNKARDGRQETEREGSNLNLREAVTQVVILTSCECSSVFLLQLFVPHSGASSFARWNKAALHGEDLKRHLFTPRSQTELSCTGITRSKMSYSPVKYQFGMKLLWKKVATVTMDWTGVAGVYIQSLSRVIVVSRGSSLWPDVTGRHRFPFVIHTQNRNCRN